VKSTEVAAVQIHDLYPAGWKIPLKSHDVPIKPSTNRLGISHQTNGLITKGYIPSSFHEKLP